MGRTITRADLSEAVYQKVGLSRAESAELVETFLTEVSDTIARGETVKLSSFGSFIVRSKGERRRPAILTWQFLESDIEGGSA